MSANADSSAPFWETTPLRKMSGAQWESLCDGCGLCCLVKLQDEKDPKSDVEAEVFLTDVACRLLDCSSCRCSNYAGRKTIVPECLVLSPDNLDDYANWLPETCGYRRLNEGKSLPSWHPLITGDPISTQTQGPAMAGKVTPETRVPDAALEDHIIAWPVVKPS